MLYFFSKGKLCDQHIDDCASNPCVRGECEDLIGGYSCKCPVGWIGKDCQQNQGWLNDII